MVASSRHTVFLHFGLKQEAIPVVYCIFSFKGAGWRNGVGGYGSERIHVSDTYLFM